MPNPRLNTSSPAAGTRAPLAFSPRYAAPEVLRAYEAKEREVLVEPSMDMWSVGIMAYELLTDAPAFSRQTKQQARLGSLLLCDIRGRAFHVPSFRRL
jgi:serine/threonine protein kinase